MQKLTILNTRDVKRIRELMLDQYGAFFTGDKAYVQNANGKLFLINKDIAKVNLEKLRVDKVGLYAAEVKDDSVRLSKEGAQLLAKENPGRLKHVVVLDKEEIKLYFKGVDLKKDLGGKSRYVLIKYENDIIGCSKYKEGTILNYLPKVNRGEVIV